MKQMKRWMLAIVIVIALSGCGGDKKVVVDSGGVGFEKDVMIYEAGENTRQMDQNAQ